MAIHQHRTHKPSTEQENRFGRWGSKRDFFEAVDIFEFSVARRILRRIYVQLWTPIQQDKISFLYIRAEPSLGSVCFFGSPVLVLFPSRTTHVWKEKSAL